MAGGMKKETERVGQLPLGESFQIYTAVYISLARTKFQGKPRHDIDWERCFFFLGDLAQILLLWKKGRMYIGGY